MVCSVWQAVARGDGAALTDTKLLQPDIAKAIGFTVITSRGGAYHGKHSRLNDQQRVFIRFACDYGFSPRRDVHSNGSPNNLRESTTVRVAGMNQTEV